MTEAAQSPFTITDFMRKELFEIGYSAEDVNKMTPDKAWDIILTSETLNKDNPLAKTRAPEAAPVTEADRVKQIGDEAMKLLASGGPEDVLNEVIKKATEKLPLSASRMLLKNSELTLREVGIEKGQRVIDQPVRGTSMGRTAPGVRPDGEMFSELTGD